MGQCGQQPMNPDMARGYAIYNLDYRVISRVRCPIAYLAWRALLLFVLAMGGVSGVTGRIGRSYALGHLCAHGLGLG